MKKIEELLIIIFAFLSVFFYGKNLNVNAVEDRGHIVDVVDNIQVYKTSDMSNVVRKYDKVTVKIEWSQKEKLKEGDIFYIDLPEQLYNVSSSFAMTVGLEDEKQKQAGTCTIEGKRFKCVFNDYVNNYNNIKGTIYIERLFVGTIEKSKEKVPLKFIVNGKKEYNDNIEVTTVDSVNNADKLEKYGYFDVNKSLVWNLKVNLNYKYVENLVIEDYVGEGQSIDKNSLRIFTCSWNEKGELIYESLSNNLINEFRTEIENNHFKIYVGNTDKNYFVTYNVITSRDRNEYTNRAEITGENIEREIKETSIEALKDYADAVGDNKDFEETKDKNNSNKTEGSLEGDKDNFKEEEKENSKDKKEKEETNSNDGEDVDADLKVNTSEKEHIIVKSGDSFNIVLVLLICISILVIIISRKNKYVK